MSAVLLNIREHTRASMRFAGLMLCFLVSISSSVLYTFAWSPMVLVVSRTLAGLGAGALTLLMSTLVAATSESNRTSSIANFFIAAAIGEIVGPLHCIFNSFVRFPSRFFYFQQLQFCWCLDFYHFRSDISVGFPWLCSPRPTQKEW